MSEGLPSIAEVIKNVMGATASPLVLNTILATLPVAKETAAGSLDVVSVQSVISHVEAGVKMFTRDGAQQHVAALRHGLTLNKVPRPAEAVIPVQSDDDVLTVQRKCQDMTRHFFRTSDGVRLATVASELARNIYMYAKRGEMRLTVSQDSQGIRFDITASDKGPGIPNVDLILSGKYVSRTGLGRGLFGTKVMLDSLDIQSSAQTGTVIRGTKRARR